MPAGSDHRPESPVKPKQLTKARLPETLDAILLNKHPIATGVYEMSKLSYEATHCRRLWVRAKELSLGSLKRELIEVSFLKRESAAKDSTPCCSASCFKEVSLGPAGRC